MYTLRVGFLVVLSLGMVLASQPPQPAIEAPATTTASSGLMGTVTLGAACPGPAVFERPCHPRPYVTGLTIQTPEGGLITRVVTDAKGAYRVVLPAGSYLVVPDRPVRGFPHARRVNVMVQPRAFTKLDIVYDTGLRMR